MSCFTSDAIFSENFNDPGERIIVFVLSPNKLGHGANREDVQRMSYCQNTKPLSPLINNVPLKFLLWSQSKSNKRYKKIVFLDRTIHTVNEIDLFFFHTLCLQLFFHPRHPLPGGRRGPKVSL